ncbi:MAG: VWA domain-containing protein, partial [Lentisphaeria bacterium]|nr:VWA domain-containing protein [Lentisphaeria bacterium]
MFEFAHPFLLFLLLLLPLLWYYVRNIRKNPSVVTPSTQVFHKIAAKKKTGIANWFYLVALLLVITALARPRTGDEKVIIRSKGIDIVLAIDMSGSMRAIDVPRNITSASELAKAMNSGEVRNRLETAKEEIRKFILARPNDRIGLIGFADLAYSFSPPTLDHTWLLERLRTLEPGQLGDATGIASAISSGTRRLKNSTAPRR